MGGRYRTTNVLKYVCIWPKKVSKEIDEMEVKSTIASVVQGEKWLQQSVSHAHCEAHKYFCSPTEGKGMVIWCSWPKMEKIMHDTGIQRINITHNLVTIPALVVGGSIMFQDENVINLDSSYTISKKNLSVEDLPEYDVTSKKTNY